jgi:hypothetical protein
MRAGAVWNRRLACPGAMKARNMASFRALIIVLLTVLAPPVSGAEAPEQTALAFYRAYAELEHVGRNRDAAALALSALTPDLARLVREAERRRRRGVPALDFDYILDAQENESFKDLRTKTITTGDGRARVQVTFRVAGESKKIMLDMRRNGERWQIADFGYSHSKSLRGLLQRNLRESEKSP